MTKMINIAMLLSLVLLVVSFSKRNDFPDTIDAVRELANEPQQTQTNASAFEARYGDVSYQVAPEYEYELYGLVVSYRHHSGDSMLHKLWNDHLNMTDVCVVWGKTALSTYLNQFDFWNGQFTCNFSTRSDIAWNSFDQYQISNNHLISDDEVLRKRIQKLNVGDQIRVAGFLSSYGQDGGAKRGTSTVRTDTGNGACETIFVKEFDIVKQASNPWRATMMLSLFSLITLVFIYFIAPFRAHS